MLRLVLILFTTLLQVASSRSKNGPARPSWDFRFEWIVRFLRVDFEGLSTKSYAAQRRDLNGRKYPAHSLKRVERRRETIENLPGVWFEPKDAGPGMVLFLHGGSFLFGSIETSHAEFCAGLAERSGTRVLGIDYRLAPENPYPAALDDTLAVLAALRSRGIPLSEIVLPGDSAGGNLALAVQIALRDRGLPKPKAALLVSPWLDLTASRPSCREADGLDYGQTKFLMTHARDYAGVVPLADPRVSPLFAKLGDLAPTAIVVGSAERLYDEGVEFVELARKAGIEIELIVAEDMPHNPPAIAEFHPNAERSFVEAAAFVRRRLARE